VLYNKERTEMNQDIIKKIISIVESSLESFETLKQLIGSICHHKEIKRQDIILIWMEKRSLTMADLFKKEGQTESAKMIAGTNQTKLNKYLAGELKFSPGNNYFPKSSDTFYCKNEEDLWIKNISLGLQVPVWIIEAILRG
jgi:hypothetical protein